MNLLAAVSAVLGLIALLFFAAMLRNSRRGRLLRATGSLAGGVSSAAVAGIALLLMWSYLSYERLTAEQPVGVIEFTRSGPDEYSARLMLEGRLDRIVTLAGDEWQLDARIVTWKPPATIFGLEPVYQLERLSGRYSDVLRERRETRTVHDLLDERPLDLWQVARRFPALMPGVDAYYGTATYLPMADGARFRLTLSRDALIARPVNEAARRAVGDWGKSDV